MNALHAAAKQDRLVWVLASLLMLATVAIYWPVTSYEFINFDDPIYVTENRVVQRGLMPENILWAFTTMEAQFWHPLTWLSHMLDCQLYGLKAGGHHLTNLLLHLANTLLLFGVLRRMTGVLWRSSLVAALFALHPLHVESVAWVAERKDVLSTFLWMLTLWAYTRYAEESKVQSQKSKVWYSMALGFFALGLMAKPMLVTLPFVLLLLDYWPLRRFELSSLNPQRSTLLRLVNEKVPFLVLAGAACVVAYWAQQSGGTVVSVERLPVGVRLGNAVISCLRYAGKALWPVGLAVPYPYQMWPLWAVGLAVVILAGGTAVVVWRGRRERWLAMGWFWYVGTLVPVSGLVQVGSHAMADRYTYIPIIGLFILLVWGMGELLTLRRHGKSVLRLLSVAAVVACMGCSWAQIKYWRNSILLFEHAVAVTTNNAHAHFNLGNAQLQLGRMAEAVREYEWALRLKPRFAEAYDNLGTTLVSQGRVAQAILRYEQAVSLKPEQAKLHNNLGAALFRLGRVAEAIGHYEEALRLKPEYADAHYNLGLALVQLGQGSEAAKHYEQALRVMPEFADAHYHLGNALIQQGRLLEAIGQFEQALRLKPEHVEARHNLGITLIQLGKVPEAVGHLEQVLRLRPGDAETGNNLGFALVQLGEGLAAQGKWNEAVAQYARAVRVSPDSASAQDGLGFALSRAGRGAEAVAHYRNAVAIDPGLVQAQNHLAWVLATATDPAIRNVEEAVRWAERACELTTNREAIYLDTLGMAYSEAGRFQEAVAATERAAGCALAAGDKGMATRIESRLEHYRARRAYHAIEERNGS